MAALVNSTEKIQNKMHHMPVVTGNEKLVESEAQSSDERSFLVRSSSLDETKHFVRK